MGSRCNPRVFEELDGLFDGLGRGGGGDSGRIALSAMAVVEMAGLVLEIPGESFCVGGGDGDDKSRSSGARLRPTVFGHVFSLFLGMPSAASH